MNTHSDGKDLDAPPLDVRAVVPLTLTALRRGVSPEQMIHWLAGFGVEGAVGYDTTADVILDKFAEDSLIAAEARERIAVALSQTLYWLADEHRAGPPRDFAEIVVWEACVLATRLARPDLLASALRRFYEVARMQTPWLLESTRRELTEALRVNQPKDLQVSENEGEKDFWEGLWLNFLADRDGFLACFRDDAYWNLLVLSFGERSAQKLRGDLSAIRQASDLTYSKLSCTTNSRLLNALKTEGATRLHQIKKANLALENAAPACC